MPTLRLRRHQATFSDEDILINQADIPGLQLNDVVELRPPKSQHSPSDAHFNQDRILLQVRKWPETNQTYANAVSIKDSVVNNHLKLFSDVLVNKVDKRDVVVDSIEICFSNAYLARSYMWGLRNHLNNRCVYQRQKLDYLHIRSQICEIWAHGNKVTSGYVDDDTKIVFRSASSLVYLFIQMSSEMWDYDINGDLYCEKAINGFLTDLFDTWRRNDCSHDITIVLFSRTFYDAQSLDEFPQEMRECLQVDYRGIFYEDCYRVAFQNDRFDLHDWNTKLTILKSLFNQYQKEVINRHQEKYDMKIPRAYNSSAAQGNFLEVLNMSLNVFEKHYFDRSFDRTGQLSVVVSPGVGVFEVDFELTNLTKQRIIDNGIGSDLVCLGEQPLHTVPLLKFNSKSSQLDDNQATCDVYNMPHWINLSFYSSHNQVYYSNFIPRIKLPTLSSSKLKTDSSRATVIANNQASGDRSKTTDSQDTSDPNRQKASPADDLQANVQQAKMGVTRRERLSSGQAHNEPQMSSHPSSAIPDLVDYDEYDAQVFKANSSITGYHQQTGRAAMRLGGLGPGCGGATLGLGGDRSILADMDPNVGYLSDEDDDDDDDDDFLERDKRNKSASIQRRSSDVKNYQEYSRNIKRQASENLPISNQGQNQCSNLNYQLQQHNQNQTTFTRMSLVDSYLSEVKIKPESADDLSVRGYNVQSSRLSRSSSRPKALINPFDPSHMTIKLTPNRRRWTHVFPQGPTGMFIQQHHYQPMPQKSALPYLADVSPPAAIPENEPLQQSGRIGGAANAQPPLGGSSLRRDPFPMRSIQQNYHSDNFLTTRQSMVEHPFNSKTLLATSKLGLKGTFDTPNSTTNKSTLVSNDTIRYAWCASGEQEWTPAITTGVDWKSLTMPACLPLTTDFFPSKTSLQNDYVISEYNIDASFIHSRYTLIEVYRELVCQRLQKGFQIILLPGQKTTVCNVNPASSAAVSPTTTTTKHSSSSKSAQHKLTSSSGRLHHHNQPHSHQQHHHHQHHHHHNHYHHHHRSSTGPSKPGTEKCNCSSQPVDVAERERTEYTLSIGRIFHKLALDGNTITITHYRPRHPYPTIKIDYCYRFRAPFHETYGQSWVHFKSEKLENYSWNYLDNYICARGESTFALKSSLKFWRFRILILPSKLSLRKLPHAPDHSHLIEGSNHHITNKSTTKTRHDIYYQEFSDDERDALMESFIKLLEIINKTRRASAGRNASQTGGASRPSGGSASSTSCLSVTTTTSQQEELQQQQQQQQQLGQCSAQRSVSPSRLVVQIGNMLSGAAADTCQLQSDSTSQHAREEATGKSSNTNNNNNNNNGNNHSSSTTSAAGTAEASEPLTNQTTCSHSKCNELKFHSIIMDIDSALRDAKRAEWVHVQYHNFYEINQAFELLIKWMVASGAGIAEMVQSWSRKVGNSSVHVVPCPWEPFAMPHSGKADPLRCPLVMKLHLNCLPDFSSLDDNQVIKLQERILRLYGFTRFHDLVSTESIERQYIHMSGFAFVALPNLISNENEDDHCDAASAASREGGRKDTNQPTSSVAAAAAAGTTQRLSGVNTTDSSQQAANNVVDKRTEQQQQQQQQAKREPVLIVAPASKTSATTSKPSQNPPERQAGGGVAAPLAPSLKLIHQETISSPHEEYITRHIGGARQNKTKRVRGDNEQIEFIWSWNYMLTKRWHSPSTHGEIYAVSLMQDFKDFCQNGDNRLVEFWTSIKTSI